jgi:hypothetical protein
MRANRAMSGKSAESAGAQAPMEPSEERASLSQSQMLAQGCVNVGMFAPPMSPGVWCRASDAAPVAGKLWAWPAVPDEPAARARAERVVGQLRAAYARGLKALKAAGAEEPRVLRASGGAAPLLLCYVGKKAQIVRLRVDARGSKPRVSAGELKGEDAASLVWWAKLAYARYAAPEPKPAESA